MKRIVCIFLMLVASGPAAYAVGPDYSLISRIVQLTPITDSKSQITRMHCAGTLLSSKWLLTAAHCFVDNAQNVALKCVHEQAGAELTRHAVRQFIRHDQHDIVLLQLLSLKNCLPENLTLASEWKTIARKIKPGETLALSKGSTNSLFTLEQSASDSIQQNQLDIMQVNPQTYVADDTQCLTQGDSGTPAFTSNEHGAVVLAAILISGTSDCPSLQILANVADFNQWITSRVTAESN